MRGKVAVVFTIVNTTLSCFCSVAAHCVSVRFMVVLHST